MWIILGKDEECFLIFHLLNRCGFCYIVEVSAGFVKFSCDFKLSKVPGV